MSASITLGSFNLRNLVPASTDALAHFFYNSRGKNAYWPEQYAQKRDWIADQLANMGAPIVGFQELFAPEPLEDAIEHSPFRGAKLLMAGEAQWRDTRYRGAPARIYALPRVGLMVGGGCEVLSWQTLEHFPEEMDFGRSIEEDSGRVWRLGLSDGDAPLRQFNRPVLRARLRLPAKFRSVQGVPKGETAEITVLVAHLKSKRSIASDAVETLEEHLLESAIGQARSLTLRALEAAALRGYVLRELRDHPDVPVILMGDLNDGPRSVTTQTSGGLDRAFLPAKFGKNGNFRRAQNAAVDYQLHSAFDLQTRRSHRDVYYTHVYDGYYDLLDHIMVSRHFVPSWARDGQGSAPLGKVGTLRVYNDHLLNAELDDLRSSDVGRYLHTRSDHGQVAVRLDWSA